MKKHRIWKADVKKKSPGKIERLSVEKPKLQSKKRSIEEVELPAKHVCGETKPGRDLPKPLQKKRKVEGGGQVEHNTAHRRLAEQSVQDSSPKSKEKRFEGQVCRPVEANGDSAKTASKATRKPFVFKPPPDRTTAHTEFQKRLLQKLQASRFRWLNEKLYSTSGNEARVMFQEEPKLFELYHSGFRTQVKKWPVNPLDIFIAYLKRRPDSLVVADFGCGEGKLAKSVKQRVHSFDLVASAPHIVACDIAHVPLEAESVNVAVFCLALMGTNYLDFIKEARRVLVPKGVLKIAEVVSRLEDWDDFTHSVQRLGFSLVSKDDSNKMFILFEFLKTASRTPTSMQADAPALKACKYKKR